MLLICSGRRHVLVSFGQYSLNYNTNFHTALPNNAPLVSTLATLLAEIILTTCLSLTEEMYLHQFKTIAVAVINIFLNHRIH